MSENIIITSDDNFAKDVLKSNMPVLVDFWAEWCGPCKSIASTLEDIAVEYKGKVKVAKLNIDENPDTPVKYNIRGIPTLILFKGGEEVDTKVGALTKSDLITFLDNNL